MNLNVKICIFIFEIEHGINILNVYDNCGTILPKSTSKEKCCINF